MLLEFIFICAVFATVVLGALRRHNDCGRGWRAPAWWLLVLALVVGLSFIIETTVRSASDNGDLLAMHRSVLLHDYELVAFGGSTISAETYRAELIELNRRVLVRQQLLNNPWVGAFYAPLPKELHQWLRFEPKTEVVR